MTFFCKDTSLVAGAGVAPYHITVVKMWFKENFVQFEKGRQRKEMSDLIEIANIIGQFVYKMVNMTFKVEIVINEDPQEFSGRHSFYLLPINFNQAVIIILFCSI